MNPIIKHRMMMNFDEVVRDLLESGIEVNDVRSELEIMIGYHLSSKRQTGGPTTSREAEIVQERAEVEVSRVNGGLDKGKKVVRGPHDDLWAPRNPSAVLPISKARTSRLQRKAVSGNEVQAPSSIRIPSTSPPPYTPVTPEESEARKLSEEEDYEESEADDMTDEEAKIVEMESVDDTYDSVSTAESDASWGDNPKRHGKALSEGDSSTNMDGYSAEAQSHREVKDSPERTQTIESENKGMISGLVATWKKRSPPPSEWHNSVRRSKRFCDQKYRPSYGD